MTRDIAMVLPRFVDLAAAVSAFGLSWDDETTPKTDTPARFGYQWGGPLYPRASWITAPDLKGFSFEYAGVIA